MKLIVDSNIDWKKYENIPEDANYIKPATHWMHDVIDQIHAPETVAGVKLPWEKTHKLFRFKPGEVTIWSGFNGHKKSMLLGQVITGLNYQDQKACIASLEMKPGKTLMRMTLQALAMEKPSGEFIGRYMDWTDDKLWVYDQTGMVHYTRMIALTQYCFEVLDIDHMVIDSLMKCGISTKDHDAQKTFIDSLCTLAKDHNKHIHLVTHARKGMDEFAKPTKGDVKGAGDITDQCDNVLLVWDNKRKFHALQKEDPDQKFYKQPDLVLMCRKQRNGPWEGDIYLWFNEESLQHVANNTTKPMNLCGLNNEIIDRSEPGYEANIA